MPVYLTDDPTPEPTPASQRKEKTMPRPCDYYLIRDDILAAINRYALNHEEKGHFLTAVLENNLRDAFGRADPENRKVLQQIVAYCYNEIPSASWGSKAKVKAWLEMPREEWIEGAMAPETTTELARQTVAGIWGSGRNTGRRSGR